jgi:hypothetical protein
MPVRRPVKADDDSERARIAGLISSAAGELDPSLEGPVQVLEVEPAEQGGSTAHVSATRMIPASDDDPRLAGVYVGVPVSARVELDAGGRVRSVGLEETSAESTREARAFVRNLVATGAVRGTSATGHGPVRRGPPTRATHEVVTDERGRRVLRRIGFTVAPPGGSSSEA